MVDVLASGTHFVDHLAPVWRALPERARGTFYVTERGITAPVAAHARLAGLEPVVAFPPAGDRLVLVASSADHKAARRAGRPVVYLNHGIGQAARDPAGPYLKHDSYVGTDARTGCALFLTPGPTVTALMRQNYPDAVTVEVGCPKLDAWIGHKPNNIRPRVCLSTNWDSQVVPEFRSALPHFVSAIPALAAAFDLVSHSHPRATHRVKPLMERHGVPYLDSFEQVLDTCDLYITDSSSTLFEFAATGRPVVVLNAPWYRRDVSHGLRFWDAAHVGLHCDDPQDRVSVTQQALTDPPSVQEARADAISLVYGHTDGQSAHRAAEAIQEVLHGRT